MVDIWDVDGAASTVANLRVRGVIIGTSRHNNAGESGSHVPIGTICHHLEVCCVKTGWQKKTDGL